MNYNIEDTGTYRHRWEENGVYTLKEDKIYEIHKTNITEEAALDCFKRHNWWYPDSSGNNFYSNNDGSEWNIGMYTNPPHFILFDCLDEETQIIRELEFINPPKKSFRESQRVLYNPKTGYFKSIEMPRSHTNPYKVTHPFYGTNKEYIEYSIGGYSNTFGGICLGSCFFYFRKLVPGMKKENILKREIQKIYNFGNKKEFKYGKYNSRLFIGTTAFRSLITGNSLSEILWGLGYEDNFYNGYGDTRNLDLGFLENHRKSFLISRRYGVNFVDKDIMSLWIDTIKLLEEFGMDIKNPKYISKELKKTHDILVNRKNKKLLERGRRLERERQLLFEKSLLKEKEKLSKEDQEYRESKKRYLGWYREFGDLKAIPVQNVTDCLETGIELSNCCYSAKYYLLENSILLKVYVKGVLTELAQIGIKDKEIYQCSGKGNICSPYHNEILKFLKENIKDL